MSWDDSQLWGRWGGEEQQEKGVRILWVFVVKSRRTLTACLRRHVWQWDKWNAGSEEGGDRTSLEFWRSSERQGHYFVWIRASRGSPHSFISSSPVAAGGLSFICWRLLEELLLFMMWVRKQNKAVRFIPAHKHVSDCFTRAAEGQVNVYKVSFNVFTERMVAGHETRVDRLSSAGLTLMTHDNNTGQHILMMKTSSSHWA